MTPLSIGVTFSDRVEALLDGRVSIEGAASSVAIVEAQTLFRRVLREQAYDVAELSMASHIAAIGAGRRDYVGVPAFLSRSLRHANLYVRTDRGIDRPEDLAGRRIGLIDWQQTASLWVRGLLADRYGVDRTSVTWIAAGLQQSVHDDRVAFAPPPGIALSRSADTLDAMLRAGELDAIVSPRAPTALHDPDAPVRQMWPDSVAVERRYWLDTRIFPIMHVLVVRRTLVEAEPGLPQRLFDAFERAREIAAADLRERDFPKVALPWLGEHARFCDDRLGGDPWTYGLDANRDTIATMLRYAVADGLAPPDLTVADLFA